MTNKSDTHRHGDIPEQAQQLNITVIIVMFVFLAAVFFAIVRFFIVPVILATTLAILFTPFFKWMLARVFRNNRTVTAIVCCTLLAAGVFVPVFLAGRLAVIQSIDIYSSSEQWSERYLHNDIKFPPSAIRRHPLYKKLELDKVNLKDAFREIVKSSGKLATVVINRTSAGIIEIVAGSFLTIFSLFFFFRDGDRFIERMRYLSPLRPQYERLLISRFILVAQATIKGTVIIGLIQGVMGALILLALGFKAWLLWGVVMIVLSIIPIVGSYFVLVPAALYLFWSGRIMSGVVTLIVATLLNYGVDYLLRPRLVGHDTKVHDLIILFSTLGGLAVFGVTGFIIGPVIAMLFVTMIDIYAKEFKNQLAAANSELTCTAESDHGKATGKNIIIRLM